MTLMIGTPAAQGFCAQYLQSVTALMAEARDRLDVEVCVIPGESLLPRARHRIAHQFLKSTHSHLLFVDADMGFRPEDVFAMLAADKDIVAGVAPQKTIQWDRVRQAMMKNLWQPLPRTGAKLVVNFPESAFPWAPKPTIAEDAQGCVVVQDAGTGFMLIKRRVFEEMAKKIPSLGFDDDREGPMHAFFETMIRDRRYLSEDFAFCRRWQDLCGTVHAYVSADLKHVGQYVYEGSLKDQLIEVP